MSGLWWGNAADEKAFLSAEVSWFSTSTLGKTATEARGMDVGNHLEQLPPRRKSMESTHRRSTVGWKLFSAGELGMLCAWKEEYSRVVGFDSF